MKYRKWSACGDNHGDAEDPSAVKAFHEFCRWWKPEIKVHLGDCFDLRCMRKKASEMEQRERIEADIDGGLRFIKQYKPTHFLRGNHDERLWDVAMGDDGKLADFAARLILDIKEALGDAVMLPYDRRKGVLKLGSLKFIHGYNAGVTAARIAAQIYGSVVMGHVHAIDHYSIPGLDRRMGRCVGCLCDLNMQYARAMPQTLRHAHGWGYGLLYPNGEYQYFQAEKVAGSWLFPSEFREVKA